MSGRLAARRDARRVAAEAELVRARQRERGEAADRRREPSEALGLLGRVLDETRAERIVWNRDYSPFAKARDAAALAAAAKRGVRAESFKDRVAYESGEVLTKEGRPFAVYTPYRNAWRLRFSHAPEEPERLGRLPPPKSSSSGATSTPRSSIGTRT